MEDYSFIRLKDTLAKARDIGDSPVANHFDNTFVQLLTNESYLQITNVDNGISFGGDYIVEVVNCEDEVLQTITNNVFIEEFTNTDGLNQIAIEFVNLGTDFYRKHVYFKFTHTLSNAVYYSNGVNITNYQREQTSYFEYSNVNNFSNIGYTNSQKKQAIRLRTYFDIPVDESEVQDYYQINNSITISARALIKEFERYKIDYINSFNYTRFNRLLKHDIIYLNNVRVTNKATIESDDRVGDSNWFSSSLTISKNYNDIKAYAHQIYAPIEVLDFKPSGVYSTGFTIPDIRLTFSQDITLLTGEIRLYNSAGTLLHTRTEADFIVSGVVLETLVPFVLPNANDTYYLQVDNGMITGINVFEGISDTTTWTYTVQAADFLASDFNNNDFLT